MNLYIPNECNTAMLSAIGIIIYWYLLWLLLEIGFILKISNRSLGLSIDAVYFLTFFLQTWNLLASDSNFFFIVAFVRIFFHIIETNTGFNAGQLSFLHCRYITVQNHIIKISKWTVKYCIFVQRKIISLLPIGGNSCLVLLHHKSDVKTSHFHYKYSVAGLLRKHFCRKFWKKLNWLDNLCDFKGWCSCILILTCMVIIL